MELAKTTCLVVAEGGGVLERRNRQGQAAPYRGGTRPIAPLELPCGHVLQPCSVSPDESLKLNRILIQLAVERHTQLTDESFIERMTAGDETSRQTEIYELHGNLPSKSCWHVTHKAPPFQVEKTDPDE